MSYHRYLVASRLECPLSALTSAMMHRTICLILCLSCCYLRLSYGPIQARGDERNRT